MRCDIPKVFDDCNPDEVLTKLIADKEAENSGYYKLPDAQIGDILAFTPSVAYDTVAVIGIGGSSLGSKAIHTFLKLKHDYKRIVFFENSDPIDIESKFKTIEKSKTLFILISKSGGTIETTSIYKTILHHYAFDLSTSDKERIIVISDHDSPLSQYAHDHKLTLFHLEANVGGRFSVFSAVGLVPLKLIGVDIEAILKGASKYLAQVMLGKDDTLLRKAAYFATRHDAIAINVLFSYSSVFEDFNKWYIQLWGESLGKIDIHGKNVGFTPIGITGSIDQHSFLQLIIEGPRDKTVTFIEVADFGSTLSVPHITLEHIEKTDYINGHSFNKLINSQLHATMKSVEQSGVSVDKIVVDGLDEHSIGELIIYFELLTSAVGVLLEINTYNQPGVELGKKILEGQFIS